MRGRAAEIADPSAFGWEVLWEALKTEPPAEDATLTQELGLDRERELTSPYGGPSWRALEVHAGPDGILARRPVTAHPQGYLYDLWLIERLADALGA
jgi:hypothetical protein